MLAINLSEMWPCIFGSYTNMIAAQIHLQCVSIKPSSDIWSLSVIINNDIVIIIITTIDIVIIIITTIRIIITNINLIKLFKLPE